MGDEHGREAFVELCLRGTLSAGRFSLFAAGRRVPPEGNDDGSGAPFITVGSIVTENRVAWYRWASKGE
jgi:hypothetical protein